MYPTRRLWAVTALLAVLVVLAVVFARPHLLVGGALIGAWVLTRQYTFVRELERLTASLSVSQVPARTAFLTDEAVPVTLTVGVDEETRLAVSVEASLPTASREIDRLEVSLSPGMTAAERTVDVTWPIAGRHAFEQATMTATDGFFCERLSVGQTPTVTVDPRGPRRVHVGEGGNRVVTAYGEHDGTRRGTGLEPAEIREYLPGDTATRIDWKATARLGSPHVREYEAETERRALLVVDHRSSLATGPPAETKLDYLREVALATTASVRGLGDPIALLTVGEEGITNRIAPSSSPSNYASVRRHLLSLEPTIRSETDADVDAETNSGADESSDSSVSRPAPEGAPRHTGDAGLVGVHRPRRSTASEVHQAFTTLRGETGPFARALRPFYADRRAYRSRIETDPLYGAVTTMLEQTRGSLWTVIFTDDTRPRELRETVKLARRNGDRVLVLLAPSVLYEPDGLADVDRAYDRYVVAEELRRELARMDRVNAFEVAPRDRLSTVLAAGTGHGGVHA